MPSISILEKYAGISVVRRDISQLECSGLQTPSPIQVPGKQVKQGRVEDGMEHPRGFPTSL